MFIFKLGVIIWGGVGVINYLIEINIKKNYIRYFMLLN